MKKRKIRISVIGIPFAMILACGVALPVFAASGASVAQPAAAHETPPSLHSPVGESNSEPSTTTPPTLPEPIPSTVPVTTTSLPPVATTTTTIATGIPANQRVQQTTSTPTGATISPAPASDSPAVSQQQIISAEAGTPGGVGYRNAAGTPVHPTVLFGLVTDSEYGHMNSDGSVTPFYTNYPVWIVEYQGALTPVGGGSPGPSGPSTTSAVPPVHVGTSMTFFDAQTGSYLFGVSF